MKAEITGDADGFLVKDGIGKKESLIEKAKEDKKAFESLMKDYVKVLYNYIYTRIPNSSDIEDIIQETLLSAWKGIGAFNYSSSFKTWLLGIANNKINDYFRTRYRHSNENLATFEDYPDEADFTEGSDKKSDVSRAVSMLNPGEKELIHLIFNAGLNYSEISTLTGIPPGTIKSRMSAIKEKLKKYLGEDYYG